MEIGIGIGFLSGLGQNSWRGAEDPGNEKNPAKRRYFDFMFFLSIDRA